MKTLYVLMPAWNSAQYIGECLRSILSQKMPRGWELKILVAVDDCEDTFRAANALKCDKVGVWRGEYKTNQNVLTNSLVALALSRKADLLLRFDSDDVMLPGLAKTGIEYMESHPGTAMARYWFRFLREGSVAKEVDIFGAHGVPFIRPAAWEALGGMEPWMGAADIEFTVRSQEMGFTIGIIPFVGMLYRIHDGQTTGLSWGANGKHKEEHRLIHEKRLAWERGEKPLRIVPKTVSLIAVNLGDFRGTH